MNSRIFCFQEQSSRIFTKNKFNICELHIVKSIHFFSSKPNNSKNIVINFDKCDFVVFYISTFFDFYFRIFLIIFELFFYHFWTFFLSFLNFFYHVWTFLYHFWTFFTMFELFFLSFLNVFTSFLLFWNIQNFFILLELFFAFYILKKLRNGMKCFSLFENVF